MRSDGVVVIAPLPDDDLRFLQAVEDLLVEAFILALLRYSRIPAGHRCRFALCHRHLNLAKQRHDLLRAEPLLRHDQLLSKLFSHNAWFKKARLGHLALRVLMALTL